MTPDKTDPRLPTKEEVFEAFMLGIADFYIDREDNTTSPSDADLRVEEPHPDITA